MAQYAFVISELTSREIKRKYARSSLGIIWSVLNPLLMMVVMSLIFSKMFSRNIENFPIYYLTGQIIWTLFDTASNSAMTALVDNKTLLIKAKLPKHTFILSRVYTALVNFGYTCIPYILMLMIFRVHPSVTMLLFPVGVLFALIISIGFSYLLATEYVFFADIKYLYSVVLRVLMYMSAVFYPVTSLSDNMQKVVNLNPIYLLIHFARECVMYGRVPEAWVWLRLGIWSVISMGIGLAVFKVKENKIMQTL
ncbi:MAG: ABC transporter permease [Lachnospiraceae bacterium]|nr:ABC transporter permease [Lachnospiraceae bacterium]